MGHSRPLFLYFRLFNAIYSKHMFNIIFCRWQDSNLRPLVSEETALPTEPLTISNNFDCTFWSNIFKLTRLTVDTNRAALTWPTFCRCRRRPSRGQIQPQLRSNRNSNFTKSVLFIFRMVEGCDSHQANTKPPYTFIPRLPLINT